MDAATDALPSQTYNIAAVMQRSPEQMISSFPRVASFTFPRGAQVSLTLISLTEGNDQACRRPSQSALAIVHRTASFALGDHLRSHGHTRESEKKNLLWIW
jgi:hypothetical protein